MAVRPDKAAPVEIGSTGQPSIYRTLGGSMTRVDLGVLGSDGTLGGPGGSPLSSSVGNTVSQQRNVLNYGAVGDVIALTDAAITSGQNLLASGSHTFVTADIGKSVLVVGAGAAWNNRGAWVTLTAYVAGDYVTNLGFSWVCANANSDATFNPNNWNIVTHTSQALYGTITGVSGGSAQLSGNASTTVSGANAWFGTDDSAAFTSAIAVGVGEVFVPLPPGGVAYFVKEVVVGLNISLRVASGVGFKLTPSGTISGKACFRLGSANGADAFWVNGCSIEGAEYTFDFTGYDPGNLIKGIYTQNPQHWRIEGARGVAIPDGNVIGVLQNSAGFGPRHGHIERIRHETAPYGFGAVQVDMAQDLTIIDTWSDGGFAVDIETDPGSTRTAERITVIGASVDSRLGPSAASGSAAVKLVAHSNTIRDIQLQRLRSTNGADGLYVSYDTSSATAYLDHVEVNGVRADGGGKAVNFANSNLEFLDFVIRRPVANGSTGNGIDVAAGVTYYDPRAEGCGSTGALAINYSTVDAGLGARAAKMFNPRFVGNSGPGITNNTIARLLLVSPDAKDQELLGLGQLLTPSLLDCQTSAGNWQKNGAPTTARDTSLGVRAMKITSGGADTFPGITSQTGTSGFAVTAADYYRVSAYYFAATIVRRINLGVFWYKSDGTFISSSSVNTQSDVVGAFTYATQTFQAPGLAAFAAVFAEVFVAGGGNVPSGEVHYIVPVEFGQVAGPALQTYGVSAGSGVDVYVIDGTLDRNSTGRSTGSGTIHDSAPRDLSVLLTGSGLTQLTSDRTLRANAGVLASRGHSGMIVPNGDGMALGNTFSPSANQVRATRFVPSESLTIQHIVIPITVAAGTNDFTDVGIYDASGNLLGNAGAQQGKSNGTGPQSYALLSAVNLVAGNTYYLAYGYGTVGTTAPTVGAASVASSFIAALFATSPPDLLLGTFAATIDGTHSLPTTATVTNSTGVGVAGALLTT